MGLFFDGRQRLPFRSFVIMTSRLSEFSRGTELFFFSFSFSALPQTKAYVTFTLR